MRVMFKSVVVMQAAMLGKYNINVKDEVMKQLEDGPLAWKAVKKKMLQRSGPQASSNC